MAVRVDYEGRDLEAMAFAKNYRRWILNEMRPYITGRVVEVGAGSGDFSAELSKLPIESLLAIEPSRRMFLLLQKKLRFIPNAAACEGYFQEHVGGFRDYFHCVVYINVLEHLPEERRELETVFRTLKAGGWLCLFVPALPQLFTRFDAEIGHLRRYRKRELVAALRDTGFGIQKATYFDFLGILPWYVHMVLLNGSLRRGNVVFYDRWVVPLARRLEAVLKPPVGKNLLVIATKPKA